MMLATELRRKTPYVVLLLATLSLAAGYQVARQFEIHLGEQGNEAYLRGPWCIVREMGALLTATSGKPSYGACP